MDSKYLKTREGDKQFRHLARSSQKGIPVWEQHFQWVKGLSKGMTVWDEFQSERLHKGLLHIFPDSTKTGASNQPPASTQAFLQGLLNEGASNHL